MSMGGKVDVLRGVGNHMIGKWGNKISKGLIELANKQQQKE